MSSTPRPAERMDAMSDKAADGMLYLLRAEPTLLPVAPEADQALAIEHRRHDEAHSCLRCGGRAQVAYIAATTLGPRWLDLCAECAEWLRRNAS